MFEDLGLIHRIVASGGEYPVRREHTADGPVDTPAVDRAAPTPAEPYRIALMVLP